MVIIINLKQIAMESLNTDESGSYRSDGGSILSDITPEYVKQMKTPSDRLFC